MLAFSDAFTFPVHTLARSPALSCGYPSPRSCRPMSAMAASAALMARSGPFASPCPNTAASVDQHLSKVGPFAWPIRLPSQNGGQKRGGA
jgi:hypothetical protein